MRMIYPIQLKGRKNKLMKRYFCAECENNIHPDNVHQEYKFFIKYKINRFSSYKKSKFIWFKNICICKRCFRNYACEKLLLNDKLKGVKK